MAFDEIRLPTGIERGALGGPGFLTNVVLLNSGKEQRNSLWSVDRGQWDIGYGIQTRDDALAVRNFFMARLGRARGFRFKDWTDYQAVAQSIGQGDGSVSQFQLIKTYASGGVSEARIIAKPVAGSLRIYRNGVEALSGWSVDVATGLVSFTSAPEPGVLVSADFTFDVPARFDSDQMDITIETYQLGSWGPIPIIEIRP